MNTEPRSSSTSDESADARFSRRGFGKRLLLGASALAVLMAAGKQEEAQAAPATDPWRLGGNTGVTTANFLGTINNAPLIVKTFDDERMRITPTGNVGIGTSAPTARLMVTTPTGIGIYGIHSGATGIEPGVRGQTASTDTGASGVMGYVASEAAGVNAAGVNGLNNSRNSNGFGVRGRHQGSGIGVGGNSVDGIGVLGESEFTAAGASGVLGRIDLTTPGYNAAGVRGVIENATGSGGAGVAGNHSAGGIGVQGNSASGYGVVGYGGYCGLYGSAQNYGLIAYSAAAGSTGAYAAGSGYGVRAYSSGAGSTGVFGQAPNTFDDLDAEGVRGVGTYGVSGSGVYMGVVGSSSSYGIFGYTTNPDQGTGAYGRGQIGVHGRSYTGYAVWGDTDTGTGVYGLSYDDGGAVKGVYGEALGAQSNGVVGRADNGTSAYGIWGISSEGYAGRFSGKVSISGNLSKGGGSFKIDHPLDPENKYLYHSFVESPDMMNVYNGNVTTDGNGEATVELPAYFEALNRDFRYQLTVIGKFAQAIISREVKNNRFGIKTDKPNVKVSWQVTGIRQDAFANANRIPVEEEKATEERGKYLHPREHGKADTFDVHHERIKGITGEQRKRGAEPEIVTPKAHTTSRPRRPERAP